MKRTPLFFHFSHYFHCCHQPIVIRNPPQLTLHLCCFPLLNLHAHTHPLQALHPDPTAKHHLIHSTRPILFHLILAALIPPRISLLTLLLAAQSQIGVSEVVIDVQRPIEVLNGVEVAG